MKYLRIFAVLGMVLCAASFAHAQRVVVGVGIGAPAPVVVGPPVCAYGYYPYAPYACAPYGYYGPEWFDGGVFIGAGPWFHAPAFWGGRVFYDRGWGYFNAHRRDFGGRGWNNFDRGRDFRGPDGDFHGDLGFHGGDFHGDRGFHGGNPQGRGDFHGGNGFHGGGGGFHGSRR